MTDQIYVLQLVQGKYYIGKTNNVDRKLAEHFEGKGSDWTNLYPPIPLLRLRATIQVIETRPIKNNILDEDTVTKEYMLKYGIDNVRGATYVTEKLSSTQYEQLNQIMSGGMGNCHICGQSNHWAAQCRDKPQGIQNTRRDVVMTNQDYGNDDNDNDDDNDEDGDDEEENANYANACFRCGRTSHFANQCFAKSDVNGDPIR